MGHKVDSCNTDLHKLFYTPAGYPEYVAVIDDFVLVVEDKADTSKQIKLTENGIIDMDTKAVTDYAVNGAYFYAKRIAQGSNFKKVFAVGVSGNEKHHEITPLWVDDRESYKMLPDLESFVSFSPQNIHEYYTRYVLEEETDFEKTTEQILKDASELHEYLRTYGTLKDQDKPLVVAGILLALDEIEYGGFSISLLTGDQTSGMRDGDKLMNAIKGRLTRSNVGPDAKKDKLLAEFSILQTSFRLNEINEVLGKTPLKFYTEFLYEHVFKNIKYQKTSEDFIGRFYGEFMSYSGGDGQTLGIILTPRHICDLMCDLVDIEPNDVVLDMACGSGSFLVRAMTQALADCHTQAEEDEVKKHHIYGVEYDELVYGLATTNMLIHSDGNSNIVQGSCFDEVPRFIKDGVKFNVVLMNPPYNAMAKQMPKDYSKTWGKSKQDPSKGLYFVKFILDQMNKHDMQGKLAVLLPMACAIGNTTLMKKMKNAILKNNMLDAVFSLPDDIFYPGASACACCMVFDVGTPHKSANRETFFAYCKDDGFKKRKNLGRVEQMDENGNSLWATIEKKWINYNGPVNSDQY